MRSISSCFNLGTLATESESDLSSKKDFDEIAKDDLSAFSIKELLISANSPAIEIEEKIDEIEARAKAGEVLSLEHSKKFINLKEKLKTSKIVDSLIANNKDSKKDYILNEKYLTLESLQYFYRRLKNDKPTIRVSLKQNPPQKLLRITESREEIMLRIENETDIEKIGDNSYKLLHKFDEQVIEFIVEHNRDKVNFIFEMVYPTDKSALGNLFPEEIQLAMFDKLAKNVPQVLDDLKSAQKITTNQSCLINIKSVSFIAKYLELELSRRRELRPFSDVALHKNMLSDNPNQNNNLNFLNQLKAKYLLDLSIKSPPKVICGVFTRALSLKQSAQKTSV